MPRRNLAPHWTLKPSLPPAFLSAVWSSELPPEWSINNLLGLSSLHHPNHRHSSRNLLQRPNEHTISCMARIPPRLPSLTLTPIYFPTLPTLDNNSEDHFIALWPYVYYLQMKFSVFKLTELEAMLWVTFRPIIIMSCWKCVFLSLSNSLIISKVPEWWDLC